MTVLELLKTHRENSKWLDVNYDRLAKEYDGKYIAVWNKSIVASSNSIKKLGEKLTGSPNLPSKDEVVIRYMSREPKGMLL